MLATQVNARKHDQLRIVWASSGVGVSASARRFWVGCLSRVQSLAVRSGCYGPKIHPPLCVLAGTSRAPPCIVFGSVVGWELDALHSCYVLLVGL